MNAFADDVPGAEHPGDAFARAQVEAFYARNLRSTARELQQATADGAGALGTAGPAVQAQRRIRDARRDLAYYEAGCAQ